ncbi:MAG: hypothetical protein P8M20_02320, partial [Planctomycetaceae bacterium]|nr:hypothetical protein [Planctomycetaceae bacterium]
LFSYDRGLRDGDWKAVSFRREAWELYNIAKDRTELNNLAEAEPERLQKMIDTWTEMTKTVLHASPKSYATTIDAKLPHRHPEWTKFDGGSGSVSGKLNRPARRRGPVHGIRARKNTKLTIVDGELRLEFSGDDPGIAMDLRGRDISVGPYRLTFRLQGGTKGGGELFYTTDPKTILPKGERIEFVVDADEKWHDIELRLPAEQRIYQLRLDVGDGVSKASVSGLTLIDSAGKRVIAWPQSKKGK